MSLKFRFLLPLALCSLLGCSAEDSGPTGAGGGAATGGTASGGAAAGGTAAAGTSGAGGAGGAPGGGGGTTAPGPAGEHTFPLPPATGKHPVFEALAPTAHRAHALRSQPELDGRSMGNAKRNPADWVPNPNVLYESEIDAAVMYSRAGDNGLPLTQELKIPVRIEKPTGGQVWIIAYDLWLGPEISTIYRDVLKENGGTKFFHVRGSDGTNGDYKDGIWKTHLNIRVGPQAPGPEIGFASMQMSAEHIGTNVTDTEPLQPSAWATHPLVPGVWHRFVYRYTEQLPVDEAVSLFDCWLVDESRPATQVHQGLKIRMPWSEAYQQGAHYAQVLQSWKTTMPQDLRVAIRNMLVLRNPSQADLDLLLSGGFGPKQ